MNSNAEVVTPAQMSYEPQDKKGKKQGVNMKKAAEERTLCAEPAETRGQKDGRGPPKEGRSEKMVRGKQDKETESGTRQDCIKCKGQRKEELEGRKRV